MQDYIRLLLIVIVSTIVVSSACGIALISQEATPDLLEGVSFTTSNDAYALGETVFFLLENDGDEIFILDGWTVQRLVGGEWQQVECHISATVLIGLEPGKNLTWAWRVEGVDKSDLSACAQMAPSVEAGAYRGVALLSPWEGRAARYFLYVEFAVVLA